MNCDLIKNRDSSVLIADDHVMTREGLKKMLETVSTFKIVGLAEDGLDSLNQISNLRPDVAILDVNLPKANGLQILEKIKKNNYSTKIILYSNYFSPTNYCKAITFNAHGILLKECSWEETLRCLNYVINGKQYISPICKRQVIPSININSDIKNNDIQKLNKLTKNEMTILKLVSEQKTTRQIADILFKSSKTIENVRYRICRKLEISGPNSLTIYSLKRKELFS